MQESKYCIVNGRITPEYDNFTSVSFKGSAVVDSLFLPQEYICKVDKFEVLLTKDICQDIMCNFSGKLPDHSILMCQLKDIVPYFTCLDPQTTIVSERTQSKRQFKLDKMQTHFMVSQSSKQRGLQLINEILSAPTNNISSNDLYSN